ncbi:AAA family ATPase [Burkholderia sp. L27(2015)]|uniref:AAA family ATPase n=1 Tax=Burkholderia sp. L27(2015) TaxID=1641858 RepID=UPI00131BCC98|nr:AAA family ATPase [Burkholderia sp. L27(2015)]
MNNKTSLELLEEPNGRYVRLDDGRNEWWRVTPSERDSLFRIEHGFDNGPVDIETVVDSENLIAKFRKWQREGFQREGEAVSPEMAPDLGFMPELARLHALAQGARHAAAQAGAHDTSSTGTLKGPFAGTLEGSSASSRQVAIGGVNVAMGPGGPLTPQVNPAYLFPERFDEIIEDIVENRRIMLIGHTGSGKTSLIEQVAARAHYGVIRSNMNGQTTIGDFVGFWTVKGGETVWVDGVLPVAMRTGAWLIIDEIDFAEPAILAVLTAVLETSGRLMLKEKGNEIVAPHPNFRLFATANAVGAMSQFRHLYQGSNLMNEAFLDRWRVYLIDYLSPQEEAQVLMQTLAPAMTMPMAHTLAAIAADCRAAFAREDLASAFSTRRLLDWAQLMVRTGDPERAADPTIYAKVSPADAALIRSVIRQHIAPAQ